MSGYQINGKKVIFTEPRYLNLDFLSTLNLSPGDKVVFVDLAIEKKNGTPELFEAIEENILLVVDHHTNPSWEKYSHDPRFVLVDRNQAPACPELITTQLEILQQATIVVAHGDGDGVYSAAKVLLEGMSAYQEMDKDARAFDTNHRTGEPTFFGQLIENALKGDMMNHQLKADIVEVLLGMVGLTINGLALARIHRAAQNYQEKLANANKLAASATMDTPGVVVTKTNLIYGSDFAQVDVTNAVLARFGNEVKFIILESQSNKGEKQLTVVRGNHPETKNIEIAQVLGKQFTPFLVSYFGEEADMTVVMEKISNYFKM